MMMRIETLVVLPYRQHHLTFETMESNGKGSIRSVAVLFLFLAVTIHLFYEPVSCLNNTTDFYVVAQKTTYHFYLGKTVACTMHRTWVVAIINSCPIDSHLFKTL